MVACSLKSRGLSLINRLQHDLGVCEFLTFVQLFRDPNRTDGRRDCLKDQEIFQISNDNLCYLTVRGKQVLVTPQEICSY